MVFSSTIFLLYFLPIFLLIYHFIDRSYKNYVILAASIFFYSWGAPKFVFVILASTIVDFYLVQRIHSIESTIQRKILLALSVFINLGLLIYFKYANFFIENVNAILGSIGFEQIKWTAVILPIGISFYTFQTLTYSIDVYRKVHAPLEKLSDYILYIMCFPQLIAGPIVRFSSIADQLSERRETIDDKLLGIYRFAIGLAKKVLIANVMAEQADNIFGSNLDTLNFTQAWVSVLAYTFQIYFDFSGYSDMAIGLGRMMGFKFPENFNSPYISQNITEFWKRWHITLGSFMRDYLYIPLGGNRVHSKSRLYFNLSVVFLLSGLWHGASWNFVIWGAYHAVFLILDRIFLVKTLSKIGKIPSIIFTFIIVAMGWVIFKLENVNDIFAFFSRLFAFNTSAELNVNHDFSFILLFALLFSFITLTKLGQKLEQFVFHTNHYTLTYHFLFSFVSVIFLLLSVSSITSSDFNPFIYFRF